MKAQNLSTSLGEGRDVAPSLALPSQKPNLTVYTEELTHLLQALNRKPGTLIVFQHRQHLSEFFQSNY
jgi:hypothetical protein